MMQKEQLYDYNNTLAHTILLEKSSILPNLVMCFTTLALEPLGLLPKIKHCLKR